MIWLMIMILNVLYTTGTSEIIKEHDALSSELDWQQSWYDDNFVPKCNKDTGGKKQLQKWTRGHFFVVRAGGHIDTWQPLYQNVTLIILHIKFHYSY